MRTVRHNMVENMGRATDKEARHRLIIDEAAKAVQLFPRATCEAIGINYVPGLPSRHIRNSIKTQSGNAAKMAKLAKIVLLVNRNGTNYEDYKDAITKNGNGGMSFRNLMAKGRSFLADHETHLQELTKELQVVFLQDDTWNQFTASANAYESSTGLVNPTKKKVNPMLFITVGVLLVSVIGYGIYTNVQKAK